MSILKLNQMCFISLPLGFSYQKEYHETRKLADKMGVGDNDWIYEDEMDWEEEEDSEGTVRIRASLV